MTWLHFLLTRHRCPNLLPVLPVTNHSLQNATPHTTSLTPKHSTVKKTQTMIRNAVIISVILSLTAEISSAGPDSAVPAVIDDVTASDRPLTSAEKTETAAVDLRPLHLTAVASDPDQIAHSFRLPGVRHGPRPLSLINRRPIEVRYGHDMLMRPAKKKCKKMKRMRMKRREHDESDSDDEDGAEHEERKRLRKMMKRRMRMERENGGGFVKWISGFMNRF